MDLDPVERLTKDLNKAAANLSPGEVRFLVDAYYQMQENRKREDNQVRSLSTSGEPHGVIQWLATQSTVLERQLARALDAYSGAHAIGKWMRDQDGIGPIIAAGLLAHIDIHKAPTVGHIWRFAGLDPTQSWGKGQKRPWNASLKVLTWKIGESFVKVSGRDTAYYGKVYLERKDLEHRRNYDGLFKEQAEKVLTTKKIGKDTDAYAAYSVGKLPPAHVHARAKRYAVKLFLSHLHEVWRKHEGLEVPLPYPIAHLQHVHKIDPPV